MNITKYEHSCLDIEQDGQRLLIDPGVFTTSIPNYDNIISVIVTHMHQDHLDPEKLLAIHAHNPDVQIYTVQAAADVLKDSVPYAVVAAGQTIEVGPFHLEFAGGQHAIIHSSIPVTDNVGLTVNGKFYYPGDSFSVPPNPVEVLAIPIEAPWMKVSEAMDFITALKPKQAFPVHDAVLSEIGKNINNGCLVSACGSVGATYTVLEPGNMITV